MDLFSNFKTVRLKFDPGRALRNTWTDTDKKIDDLSAALLNLKDSFHGRLTVQSLFLSMKMLAQLDETLEKLKGLGACAFPVSECTK